MLDLDLVREAHEKYEQLSIETQIIRPDDDNQWASIAARVSTPKGTFSGWSVGTMQDLADVEEKAIQAALRRAGVGIFATPAPVPVPIKDKDKAEVASKFFPVEESAETAQAEDIECENCHKAITSYESGSNLMTVEEIATKTRDRFNKALCVPCSVKQTRSRRRTKPAE